MEEASYQWRRRRLCAFWLLTLLFDGTNGFTTTPFRHQHAAWRQGQERQPPQYTAPHQQRQPINTARTTKRTQPLFDGPTSPPSRPQNETSIVAGLSAAASTDNTTPLPTAVNPNHNHNGHDAASAAASASASVSPLWEYHPGQTASTTTTTTTTNNNGMRIVPHVQFPNIGRAQYNNNMVKEDDDHQRDPSNSNNNGATRFHFGEIQSRGYDHNNNEDDFDDDGGDYTIEDDYNIDDDNYYHYYADDENDMDTSSNGISSSSGGSTWSDHESSEPSPPEVLHWTEMMSSQGRNGSGGLVEYSSSSSSSSSSKTLMAVDSILSDEDMEQIESYWVELLPKVSYLGTEMVVKVYKALCVAYRAHRGQVRKSGEPFIIHPVQVGLLLADLRMDGETVMAGLLHDTVEDTDLTFVQVEALFGSTVRAIVEGETKVSKLPKLAFSDFADEQAENLRQMFVAMTDDYRIIIVKLADRLHNMRTLEFMKPEKQIKISRETLDIFAPLAHRMGIWQFKSELEDIAFMYLYPQEYKRLKRRLQDHEERYKETLDKSKKILQDQLRRDSTLLQQAVNVEVFGRTKELYSLWHKMETKGKHNFEHIVDVVALRVIITPNPSEDAEESQKDTDRGVWLCYHVLGLVQHLPGFQPVPTRVKDYISFPKPNGYQSLHTALMLNGQTIEVQIRTNMMHQVAEYGMASHWAYTDGKRMGNNNALFNTPWLSSIKEWQNDYVSARDFVESVRRELLGKRVFVFLRNGKILNLSRGATTIDAAFQIHTEVGLNMHGVEINGKPVPFSYELQNGDVVNILTGEGRPATDWMRYAKSRSTRSKLRSYFRARQKESLRDAGKILLSDYLWIHGPLIERASYLDYQFDAPTDVEDLAPFLPGRTQYTNVDDVLFAVGKNHDRLFLHKLISQIFEVPKKLLISAEEKRTSAIPGNVFAAVHLRRKRAEDAADAAASLQTNDGHDRAIGNTTDTLSQSHLGSMYSVEARLSGLDIGFEYADSEHLCEECLPIVGDEIVGTRLPDKDSPTTVHRVGCPHAQRAINQAVAAQKINSLQTLINQTATKEKRKGSKGVDSVSLRKSRVYMWGKRAASAAKYVASTQPVPVRLMWSDLDEETGNFSSEVVVHAQDRKLLLADCSEVVSETVEIIKTGSQTTNEHATLIFLVSVDSISQLQSLMDRLSKIRSVLSVERRFGSELL